MNYSDDLFQLIKSLTKAEKRYFKLFSGTTGGEKKYLRLFDAIDRQTNYDEEAIREQLGDERFTRQLHVAKNYLHDQILRALRFYHDEGSPTVTAQALLRNADILRQKGLFKQSGKVLRKAMEFIEEREMHLELQVALNQQEMLTILNPGEHLQAIGQLDKRRRNSLSDFGRVIEYNYILVMMELSLEHGHPRNAAALDMLNQLHADPLLRIPREQRSRREQWFADWIDMIFYYGKRDYERAYLHLIYLIEEFDRNPRLIQEKPVEYLLLMNNILVLRHNRGDSEGFLRSYEHIVEQSTMLAAYQGLQRGSVQPLLFSALYMRMAMFLVDRGEFEQCVELANSCNRDMMKWGDHAAEIQFEMFHHLVAYAYFALGQYSQALEIINGIINEPRPHRQENVYHSARLFSMIIHYELGNIEYLGCLARSVYRMFKSKNSLHQLERIILGFFQRLLRLRTRSELHHELSALREELIPLSTDTFEQGPFTYFDYISWLDSRIEGISFAEAVQRRRALVTA